jgi:hypothetical protein
MGIRIKIKEMDLLPKPRYWKCLITLMKVNNENNDLKKY